MAESYNRECSTIRCSVLGMFTSNDISMRKEKDRTLKFTMNKRNKTGRMDLHGREER